MSWLRAGLAAVGRGGSAIGRGIARNPGTSLLAAGALRDEAHRVIPRLEDEVVVEVVGQPGATKQQLYYLALATAFGLLRRYDLSLARLFVDAPTQALMVEYDAADNWVRATVRYNTGLLSSVGAGVQVGTVVGDILSDILGVIPLPGLIGTETAQAIGTQVATQINNYLNAAQKGQANNLYAQAVVYSGPKDSVVGGTFNFTNPVLPGIPPSSTAPGVPRLPFAGQAILTTNPTLADGVTPTPNPKPPGDNRSRGTFPVPAYLTQDPGVANGTTGLGAPDYTRLLIPLVFAALSDPGSANQEVFTPPAAGPAGG